MSDTDIQDKALGGVGLGLGGRVIGSPLNPYASNALCKEAAPVTLLQELRNRMHKIGMLLDANQSEHNRLLAQAEELDKAIAALEPAAPASPVSGKGEAEIPEGFIPWSGGEMPVDSDCVVEVMLNDGSRHYGSPINQWHQWWAPQAPRGVIAYRILPFARPEASGEGFRKIMRGGAVVGLEGTVEALGLKEDAPVAVIHYPDGGVYAGEVNAAGEPDGFGEYTGPAEPPRDIIHVADQSLDSIGEQSEPYGKDHEADVDAEEKADV